MDRPLTPAEAAMVGGVYGTLAVFAVIFCILSIIAGWKIFKKAGEPGWKILIPIYNGYIFYKISGITNWFWITLGVVVGTGFLIGPISAAAGESGNVAIGIISAISSIFTLFVDVYFCYKLSKAFRHGVAFAVGLFFFQPIFELILGFGASKYDKKVLK